MKKLVLVTTLLFATMAVYSQMQVKKSFADVTAINVEGLFCQVNIEAINGDMVELDGRLTAAQPNDELKILFKQTGTELKVWVEAPNKWHNSYSGTLTFKLPKSTNVNVSNVSGNVNAKGLAGSSIVLKSVSGNVQSNGIHSNLKAETVSGNVLVNMVNGNLKATSVSGNVDVNQVGGTLNASTVSGKLTVKKVQGETKATSVSGALQVTDVQNNVEASTTSGSLLISQVKGDVNSNSTSGSLKMSNIYGSIKAKTVSGSIEGSEITLTGPAHLNSMSGSITMGILNAPNELSFNIKSFSGRLNIKGLIGKEKMIVEKGGIWVYGETFSGSQSYL